MMANKVAAAALQYSKWLSRFICWVWAGYRLLVIVVSAIQPSVATAIGATIPGLDTIMMINVSTYLVNSLGEKWLYSDRAVLRWIDKGGFKHLVGRIVNGLTKEGQEEDDDDGDSENG